MRKKDKRGLVVGSRLLQELYGITLEFVELEGQLEETRCIPQPHSPPWSERWTWGTPLNLSNRVIVDILERKRKSSNTPVDEGDPVGEAFPRLVRVEHRLVHSDEVEVVRANS